MILECRWTGYFLGSHQLYSSTNLSLLVIFSIQDINGLYTKIRFMNFYPSEKGLKPELELIFHRGSVWRSTFWRGRAKPPFAPNPSLIWGRGPSGISLIVTRLPPLAASPAPPRNPPFFPLWSSSAYQLHLWYSPSTPVQSAILSPTLRLPFIIPCLWTRFFLPQPCSFLSVSPFH